MTFHSIHTPGSWRTLLSSTLALGTLTLAACAPATTVETDPSPVTGASPLMSTAAPSPDPRVGLRGGFLDAADASWNLDVVSKTRPSEKFFNVSTPGDRRLTNSDLAFAGNYVFQGNYSGYQIWDISNPRKPALAGAYVCPGSQSDVTVFKNLMFVSAEAVTGRKDCGMQGVPDTISTERARGIRIFDITDVRNPKPITIVQTCRGSHTNTIVTDPNDTQNVYIYVSGSAGVRHHNELAGCTEAMPEDDPNSSLFRIEVIRVPVNNPAAAAIVSSPRIFQGLTAVERHAENPEDIAARPAGEAPRPPRPGSNRGPTQCHDITAFPSAGIAGGACSGWGILLDIRDPANPKRIGAVSDPNFAAWHSVTFNNDGTKVLFSDEWGGGSQPRCRATDKKEWGGDAIYTINNGTMEFQSYFKLPAAQSNFENCVAHNGSPIPVPGRDIMVQSWYQGGLNVFDWTDPKNVFEIAYYDQGPVSGSELLSGGYWSAYWNNGYIVGSEMSRGLDIFELKPSALLSQNEIDAAKLVQFEAHNAQSQPRHTWPAAFPVARAYVDQLVRNNGLARARTTAIMSELNRAEGLSGSAQRTALTQLATQIESDVGGSSDSARVRKLAEAVRALANR